MNELDQAFADAIEELKEGYFSGNSIDLFGVYLVCAQFKKPPPDWVIAELTIGFEKYAKGKEKTFGDAFGISRGKSFSFVSHNKKMKEDVPFGSPLILRVHDFIQKRNIGEGVVLTELYEIAAKKFGISDSVAERYYYEIKNSRK